MDSHLEHKMGFQPNLRAKTLIIDDDTTSPVRLSPTQTRVIVETTNAVTIYLPSASEAAGRIYTIEPINSTMTPAITIDEEDGATGFSNVSLNGATERAAFYSNGISWWEWSTTYYS